MKTRLILLIIFGVASFASAQSSIRNVDFKNFAYSVSCGDADTVSRLTVRNGEYRGIKSSLGDEVYLKIYKVVFGDLDGDRREDAVVLYSCGSGASYVFFRGLIFKMKNRRTTLITEIEGGNKGDGGFYDVRIAKSKLIVERYQVRSTAGSPCCPESIEKTVYKLQGKRLVQIGRPSLRKITSTS